MNTSLLDDPSLYTSLFKEYSLLTDFYELTQAQVLFKNNFHKKRAVFQLFFRTAPFEENFTLAAGLMPALSFLESFKFEESDLNYLKGLTQKNGSPFFEDSFLLYLKNLRFDGDVWAVPEGTPIFPFQPLLRIEGSFVLLQILESLLLNIFNFSTLIATKALRVVTAAEKSPVLEFGLRRAQGPNGALLSTRSAFIGGVQATSNTLAGKLFHLPVEGTHAHSFVMAFSSEEEAFSSYASFFPDQTTLLVDTYNTVKGIKKAIEIAGKLKQKGHALLAIRLDSGNLLELSKKARDLLDDASLFEVKIIVSSDLDEYAILDLKKNKAPIDIFGVGTRLATSKNQPSLDGVYKLSALKEEFSPWNPVTDYKIKLSENLQKTSLPGRLNILRKKENGKYIEDIVYDEELSLKENFEGLLKPYLLKGKRVFIPLSFAETKKYIEEELALFSFTSLSLLKPYSYSVTFEDTLKELYTTLMKKV